MTVDWQTLTFGVQVAQLVAFIVAAFKVGRWVGQIESRLGTLEKEKD